MNDALALAFLLGFVTASPIGPIGMLCLRRTLARGIAAGLTSAAGIACAYAFWSFVAVHGVAAASVWIERDQLLLESGVGVFFLLYGTHGIFNTPSTEYPTLRRRGGLAEFLSTFLVVFLNPTTFVMFSALFALFGPAGGAHGPLESLEIALAVFSGAMGFWLVVARLVARVRESIHESSFGRLARFSSFAIASFGVSILLHCLYERLQCGG